MTSFTVVGGTTASRQPASPASPAASSPGVLRFTRPEPSPQKADRQGAPRTAGSTALAAAPAPAQAEEQAPARHLHAVPSPQEAAEVRRIAATITRAAIEVLGGTRPLQQLAPWFHKDLLAMIQLRAELSRAAAAVGAAQLRHLHRAAMVKAARASLVGPGVYEASCVVAEASRCRAVALRLERVNGSAWHVTALEIG